MGVLVTDLSIFICFYSSEVLYSTVIANQLYSRSYIEFIMKEFAELRIQQNKIIGASLLKKIKQELWKNHLGIKFCYHSYYIILIESSSFQSLWQVQDLYTECFWSDCHRMKARKIRWISYQWNEKNII